MMQFNCPKCGKTLEVSDDRAGQAETCPDCGNVTVVPAAAPPAQPEAPAQTEAPPQPPPAPAAAPPPGGKEMLSEKDARMWAMFCHLAALCALVGIPFGNIVGPLIVWLIQRDKSPLVDEHGKEALNFQISMAIYGVVAGLLCFVLIGFLLLPAIVIVNVIFVIMGAVRANEGRPHRYPLKFTFIK